MSFISQTKLRSSPLEAACQNNHLQVAQLLIINGSDVDYQNSVCNNIIIFNYCLQDGFLTEWADTSP